MGSSPRVNSSVVEDARSSVSPTLVGLDELLVSDLPDFSYAQRLLAERMIIIVAHFCTWVVNFLFLLVGILDRDAAKNNTK